ncbi:MAG TPA: hypothetical protein VKP89_01745 [Burkholderiales bacterium]|nr:hypothetical protein [Burkholderiales bacterium]
MASYAGADRGIGTRLAYWRDALGDRPSPEISPDDVADVLAELAHRRHGS